MKGKEEKIKRKIKNKRERGITLIALVITIIVLLILAGVSIAMLTGQNGILTQANNAKIKQSHSAVEEGIKLAYNEWKIETTTGATTKLASTETVTIQGEEEKAKAPTTISFLDFLKTTKRYIDDSGKIDVEKLTGSKQALGNGKTTDIYTITEESGVYILNYIDANTTPLEIWSTENENVKPALGKLADVVKVGDYVNYAPTYENTAELKEGLGTGWRVAYIENGVVTLISEGVPESTYLNNNTDDNVQAIDFNLSNINLLDSKVADNIEITTLEDVQLICSQGSIQTNQSSYEGVPYQEILEDNLNIIDIGTNYILNTIAAGQYGYDAYYYWGKVTTPGSLPMEYETFNTGMYAGDLGIRIMVDLKSDLSYYGGAGSQSDPYQIY